MFYFKDGDIISDSPVVFLGTSVGGIEIYSKYRSPFTRQKWAFIARGARDRWQQERKEFGRYILDKYLKRKGM